MAHRIVQRLACLASLLAVASATEEDGRWSRQLSTYTADINDWVPLSSPIEEGTELPQLQNKRQAVAEPRILTEPFPNIPRAAGFSSDPFSTRNYFNTAPNRQLYLQSVPSVPSAPQNFLSDQGFGQNFRFGLQPNFPGSQSFVSQPFSYENVPPPPNPGRLQGIPGNTVSFPQPSGVPQSVKAKPFINTQQNIRSGIPKFVDGYRAENATSNYALTPKKKPQSLQKIKFEGGERIKQDVIPHHSKSEGGEEVQLLYVPFDQLNRGQFNFRTPLTPPHLVNTELFSQGLPRPNTGKQNFLNEYQRPPVKPHDNLSGQNFFSDFNTQTKDVEQISRHTTPSTSYASYGQTTPRTKKLKPHQPPLAIFTIKDVHSPVKVSDVLSSLKNAETIAVLDSVNPLNAPKVFIGPSNLAPPQNYVKFDLPYLSNIEHSDNKLKQMPFFVAPLSYNTPNGFAKIPFPSPHVGSVVINSQIKDSSQTYLSSPPNQPNVNTNYYTASPPTYKPESKPNTQKTTYSFYSTEAPKTKPSDYQSNYYSFEPQTVSSISPAPQLDTQTAPPRTGSYFLSNSAPQYDSEEFANFPQDSFKPSGPIQQYNLGRQPEHTASTRTTTTSTTKPSTYPSQLLETHNPYSINQAFHFSTPLDYHNYFDDVKQPYATPGSGEPSSSSSKPATRKPVSRPEAIITEKPKYYQQSSPSYLNNYTPEIQYNSDQNLKYPVFNHEDYITQTELTSQKTQSNNPIDKTPVNKYSKHGDSYSLNQYNNAASEENNYNSDTYNKYSTNPSILSNQYNRADDSSVNKYNVDISAPVESYKTKYNKEIDTVSSTKPEYPSEINNLPSDSDTPTTYDEYNNYEPTLDTNNRSPLSTTTKTTTTKKIPTRPRSRPRYTTTPHSDSYESTTRIVTTRRPQRERRPQTSRPRYEPNKISTENPSRKPLDSLESTTNQPKTKTRGRVQYKPSDSDEIYENRKAHNGKKDEDLAYQRDILHQNYPFTLTERLTTADVEAITEPIYRRPSSKVQEAVTEIADTENAYTNKKASVSEHDEIKDASPLSTFTARSTLQTENPYVPKLPSTHNEGYNYQSRSSLAPVELSSYDDTFNNKDEDIYVKHTTPIPKSISTEPIAYATETAATEQNIPNYSNINEYTTVKQEELTTTPAVTETTKPESQEIHDTSEEENVVHTTPSYHRVRARPGVTRQHHPATTTESSRPIERRRPSQTVTHRPAVERRRTTMRIDEIEADLKTKQVRVRLGQEYRHPVYKPEPSTEPAVTSSLSRESTTKRSQFRRRRPSYTTTSTETSSTKRSYDVKNRFRGRRPTNKSTEKPEISTEIPASTTRSYTRYSHRPRLSERFNKKAESEAEVEDQDSNYSINRPRYVERGEQWSPKISSDSFKPYNPNDIADELKITTTERRSDKETELDIITAKNEYDDILLTVTPASNNRMNKKIPDIPPTLEALVEQSKVTNSDSSASMSTFESMLEEVMKSLEEQDQDEYNSNVMKHKGGEIGEIPPERIISSEDNYTPKTTALQKEITTEQTTFDDSSVLDEGDQSQKSHRRGFWKKVKVRPVTTESIEFAESQYYINTVNHLGQPVNKKTIPEKSNGKPKVTTYKPHFQFLQDLFSSDDDSDDDKAVPTLDLLKINNKEKSFNEESLIEEESKPATIYSEKETPTITPGDLDLGTGTPDPTIDNLYFTTTTEPTTAKTIDRVDTLSFLDYLFGITSEGNDKVDYSVNATKTTESEILISTEQSKPKEITTESAFIPEEITASSSSEDRTEISEWTYDKNINPTESTTELMFISDVKIDSSTESSFMNPDKIISTAKSTEISHETEICFRGKCFKTNKDIIL